MPRPGRWFRLFFVSLLIGIFIELFVVIRILKGESHADGDVAVVEINGVIEDPREIIASLKDCAEDEGVRAVVLRVDSPGGAVGSSQEIHDQVVVTAKSKPVIASFGDVAASGGYYVAAPATKIVSDPGTVTGSIGVIAQFFVIEDLLKRAHIRWDIVKGGELKDIGSPLRSMSKNERELLQGMTDDMHLQFMEAVAKGRKLPLDKVKAFADGRVMSGRQAKALGLVDELGGLEKAIEVAAKAANIKGKPRVSYPEKESFGWFKRLADGKFEGRTLTVEYRLP